MYKDINQSYVNNILLGKNSYPVIVKEIVDKIENAKAETLSGDELLKDIYKKLNESITPMLELKPFITDAEKIAPDDKTIKEVVDFCKTRSGNGDLNFIINLCKEEHFANMNRMKHPSPEKTVESIKEYFNKSTKEIEEGINEGIFDCLESDLLKKVKRDLDINEKKPEPNNLSESEVLLSGEYVKYHPVGIKYNDTIKNKVVILCENEVIEVDRNNNYTSLDKKDINIPIEYTKLLMSLQSVKYDPETNEFKPQQKWDFNLKVDNEGKVILNESTIVDKKDLPGLLMESIDVYLENGMIQPSERSSYVRDADNFITLVENYDNLILMDELNVVKSLNESSYVMYNTNDIKQKPMILSIGEEKNKKYDLFENLCQDCNNFLGMNHKLFEGLLFTQVKNERNLIAENMNKIVSLNEQQKEINERIIKVKRLMEMADVNSPAENKLKQQYNILDAKLNENIKELIDLEDKKLKLYF